MPTDAELKALAEQKIIETAAAIREEATRRGMTCTGESDYRFSVGTVDLRLKVHYPERSPYRYIYTGDITVTVEGIPGPFAMIAPSKSFNVKRNPVNLEKVFAHIELIHERSQEVERVKQEAAAEKNLESRQAAAFRKLAAHGYLFGNGGRVTGFKCDGEKGAVGADAAELLALAESLPEPEATDD